MVKLEEVSTRRLMDYYQRKGKKDELYQYIYELLSIYNIKNYQELKELILGSDKKIKNSSIIVELLAELERVEKLISSYEVCYKKPEVFTFNNYCHSDLDKETILETDGKNKGNILLWESPFTIGGTRLNQIKNLPVSEIKHLLGHVDPKHLVNLLSGKRGFGSAVNKQVYDAICFYEEQVLSCADETTEREINLFEIDRFEKREIVESEIKDIATYLVDTAKTLVWGELTDNHKKRIVRAVMATRGEYTERDRNRLIDTISNYTTLSELKNGVVKKKTLDRFIVKKK